MLPSSTGITWELIGLKCPNILLSLFPWPWSGYDLQRRVNFEYQRPGPSSSSSSPFDICSKFTTYLCHLNHYLNFRCPNTSYSSHTCVPCNCRCAHFCICWPFQKFARILIAIPSDVMNFVPLLVQEGHLWLLRWLCNYVQVCCTVGMMRDLWGLSQSTGQDSHLE